MSPDETLDGKSCCRRSRYTTSGSRELRLRQTAGAQCDNTDPVTVEHLVQRLGMRGAQQLGNPYLGCVIDELSHIPVDCQLR
jgi:hypothetical protein